MIAKLTSAGCCFPLGKKLSAPQTDEEHRLYHLCFKQVTKKSRCVSSDDTNCHWQQSSLFAGVDLTRMCLL